MRRWWWKQERDEEMPERQVVLPLVEVIQQENGGMPAVTLVEAGQRE